MRLIPAMNSSPRAHTCSFFLRGHDLSLSHTHITDDAVVDACCMSKYINTNIIYYTRVYHISSQTRASFVIHTSRKMTFRLL